MLRETTPRKIGGVVGVAIKPRINREDKRDMRAQDMQKEIDALRKAALEAWQAIAQDHDSWRAATILETALTKSRPILTPFAKDLQSNARKIV